MRRKQKQQSKAKADAAGIVLQQTDTFTASEVLAFAVHSAAGGGAEAEHQGVVAGDDVVQHVAHPELIGAVQRVRRTTQRPRRRTLVAESARARTLAASRFCNHRIVANGIVE